MGRNFTTAALILAIAAGCATVPQEYYVKKGTQRPYKINGRWYYPVESSYGFEEKGIASWYGRDFHGKKTSNGEMYNMHAMTAAHKTLPMGTMVKVTRLDDGKELIVRVNDRGPFVRGRIIDLSYKAASELGITGSGTAMVRLTALGDVVGDTLVKRDYERGDFYIQVGAFTVKDNALRLQNTLEKRYARVGVSVYDRGDMIFHRVRVAGGSTLKEAEAMKSRLEKEGFDSPYVVAD